MVRLTRAAVTWHDVENGSYEADLALWRDLAAAAEGPILDLGAGTGRVAMDLASHGHDVVALDSDPELLAALAERGPSVTTVPADAREFDLATRFALIIAPMQLTQIVGGRDGRAAMLERVREHLIDGGVFATALAEVRDAVLEGDAPPLPDMLERDGWVFSSQPVTVRADRGRLVVTRRRQAVSPQGELDEETAEIALDIVSPAELEDEARAAGLEPIGRRVIPETPDHVGSTVVLCRR
jgi:SAM-dependent methyltransferase